MADDKRKQRQDRKLVAAKQLYELRYFAKKHAISLLEAKHIIAEHGPSRRKCDEAAKALVR